MPIFRIPLFVWLCTGLQSSLLRKESKVSCQLCLWHVVRSKDVTSLAGTPRLSCCWPAPTVAPASSASWCSVVKLPELGKLTNTVARFSDPPSFELSRALFFSLRACRLVLCMFVFVSCVGFLDFSRLLFAFVFVNLPFHCCGCEVGGMEMNDSGAGQVSRDPFGGCCDSYLAVDALQVEWR